MEPSKPMLQPPIKSVGGKSKLRGKIIKRLPEGMETFAEIFCGSCWVLFAKPPHQIEVINDKDNDLVNLWRVLKWRNAELLEKVQQHLYSREEFDYLREHKPDTQDEMERALWLYLMIHMSFGSDILSPSFGTRCRLPKSGWTHPTLFLEQSRNQFKPAQERLSNVFIENMDFEKCIKKYQQPKTIFYLDPPYLDQHGYKEKFTEDDHRRLASTLLSIQGKFLLTINDHPLIRELYAGCFVEETEEARSVCKDTIGRQKAQVLIVTNYKTPMTEDKDNE